MHSWNLFNPSILKERYMSQYKVSACYTVHCYATVEAENKDDAYALAKQMDGGDFKMEPDYGLSDWHINGVAEVTTQATLVHSKFDER
jgi:hypothetical protein